MINSLYGTVSVIESTRLYLRSEGGIEWDIAVSAKTSHAFQETTAPIRLLVHLYHKDDSHLLFGFVDSLERQVFRSLLKVSGVGPRLAIQILSHLEAETLQKEIGQGNYQLLRSVPGIGEKSAQRIVLTLKGSVAFHTEQPVSDIEQALIDMGYQRSSVQRTVTRLHKEVRSDDFPSAVEYESEIMHRALQELG